MMEAALALIGVVIVGAGRSERMGAGKMFLALAGRPLLAWSVDICQSYQLLSQIAVVLNESNLDLGCKLVAERKWSKVGAVCVGGKRRQDSVRAGLMALKGCEWVIVHDGARPFLTVDLIDAGLVAARETGAAAAAVPVKDTIKVSDSDGVVRETLKRGRLWKVQTPQVFRFDVIMRAYEQNDDDVTDDASLVERSGGKVKLYMGSYRNIKVTTPEDLVLAEVFARW